MRIVMLVVVGLSVLLTGCGNKNESQNQPIPIEKLIELKIDSIVDRLLNPDKPDPLPPLPWNDKRYWVPEEIGIGISKLPDRSKRAELYERYADSLMAVDLSHLEHRDQGNMIDYIRRRVWKLADAIRYGTDADFDRIYNLRFKCIAWLRAQLYRLRPKRKREKPYNLFKNREESRKLDDWRFAYERTYHALEAYLYDLENEERIIMLDWQTRGHWKQKDAEEWRRALKKRVEDYFGRPLRSRAELIEARKNNAIVEPELAEEYKAVKACMVAP